MLSCACGSWWDVSWGCPIQFSTHTVFLATSLQGPRRNPRGKSYFCVPIGMRRAEMRPWPQTHHLWSSASGSGCARAEPSFQHLSCTFHLLPTSSFLRGVGIYLGWQRMRVPRELNCKINKYICCSSHLCFLLRAAIYPALAMERVL